MMLIADSGSTQTAWRMLDADNNIHQAQTSGINPYFQNQEEISATLKEELLPQIQAEIQSLYFYGAGCSSTDQKSKVAQALQAVFPQAAITVEHDLLAAARATCENEAGIACILGTGSNSCFYDGKIIIHNVPALGYILGDEGGGAYLGKKLIIDFLHDKLPEKIKTSFLKRFSLDRTTILQKVYQEPYPNRFLASFAKFLFHHIKDPYIYRLVYDAFQSFVEINVKSYPDYQNYPVHFVGSIAFYFNSILIQVFDNQNIMIGKIIENPIAGLSLFHQNNQS